MNKSVKVGIVSAVIIAVSGLTATTVNKLSSSSDNCDRVFTVSGTETSFIDTTAENGVLCSYSVAAINSIGEGPKSNSISVMATGVHLPSLEVFIRFVADIQKAAYYTKWVAANCGAINGGTPTLPTTASDAGKWFAFRDAILAKQRPNAPSVISFFGKGLIDAGVLTLTPTP
jgi:hypothetical protein